jgi:hypothetical protein
VAPDTDWCPAVSTTLPAIDHLYDELLLGPVGVELPSDDELPPQAAVRRLLQPWRTKRNADSAR